jgi:hypothetical protein
MQEENNFEYFSNNDPFQENENPYANGELEAEWRQVSASQPRPYVMPEWDNDPAAQNILSSRPLPVQNPATQIPGVKRLISHCRQLALPVTIEILGETESEHEFSFFPGQGLIQQLLAEYETLLEAGFAETAQAESSFLGESEFSAELAAMEQAQDLALTEVLAAEAAHAHTESEAQALTATALPINISILAPEIEFTSFLPALAQADTRLTRAMFRTHPQARAAMGLIPTIQRRVISSLKAARNKQIRISRPMVNRLFAANTAKVLTSPTVIGKALIRNQAIRSNTMPPCPTRR